MPAKKRKKASRPRAGSADPKQIRWRWWIILSSLLGLSIVILFLSWLKLFDLLGLDRRMQDLLISNVKTTVAKQFNSNVKLILVDKGQQPNPPYGKAEAGHRKYHAELIRLLSRAGAKVIVFDVEFETSSPDDQNFAQAIQEAEKGGTKIIVGGFLDPGKSEPQMGAILRGAIGDHWGIVDGGTIKKSEAHFIRLAAERNAESSNRFDEHPVIPSLALQALRMLRYPNEVTTVWSNPLAGEVRLRSGADGRLLESIPVTSEMGLLVDLPGREEIPRKSYQDILANPDDYAGSFKDNVLVIGYQEGDVLPFSDSERNPRYGSEMHATAISTLSGGQYLRPAPFLYHYLAVLLLIAITACLEIRFSKWMGQKLTIPLPIGGLPSPFDKITIPTAVVVISVVYLVLAVLVFKLGHIVFDMSYHLAALILTYYLFVIARSQFIRVNERKT